MPFEKLGLTGLPSAETITPPQNWGDLVNKYMLPSAQVRGEQAKTREIQQKMEMESNARESANDLAEMLRKDPSISSDPEKMRTVLYPALLDMGKPDIAANIYDTSLKLDQRKQMAEEGNNVKLRGQLDDMFKMGMPAGNYKDTLSKLHPEMSDADLTLADKNYGDAATKNFQLKLGQTGQNMLASSGNSDAQGAIDINQRNKSDLLNQRFDRLEKIAQENNQARRDIVQLKIDNPSGNGGQNLANTQAEQEKKHAKDFQDEIGGLAGVSDLQKVRNVKSYMSVLQDPASDDGSKQMAILNIAKDASEGTAGYATLKKWADSIKNPAWGGIENAITSIRTGHTVFPEQINAALNVGNNYVNNSLSLAKQNIAAHSSNAMLTHGIAPDKAFAISENTLSPYKDVLSSQGNSPQPIPNPQPNQVPQAQPMQPAPALTQPFPASWADAKQTFLGGS